MINRKLRFKSLNGLEQWVETSMIISKGDVKFSILGQNKIIEDLNYNISYKREHRVWSQRIANQRIEFNELLNQFCASFAKKMKTNLSLISLIFIMSQSRW